MDYHVNFIVFYFVAFMITRISTQTSDQISEITISNSDTNTELNTNCNNSVCDTEQTLKHSNSASTTVSHIPSEHSVTERLKHVTSVTDRIFTTPESKNYSTFTTEIPFSALMLNSSEENNSTRNVSEYVTEHVGENTIETSFSSKNGTASFSDESVPNFTVNDQEAEVTVNQQFSEKRDSSSYGGGNAITTPLPSTSTSDSTRVRFSSNVINQTATYYQASSPTATPQSTIDPVMTVSLPLTIQENIVSSPINTDLNDTIKLEDNTSSAMELTTLNPGLIETSTYLPPSEATSPQSESLMYISSHAISISSSSGESAFTTSKFNSEVNVTDSRMGKNLTETTISTEGASSSTSSPVTYSSDSQVSLNISSINTSLATPSERLNLSVTAMTNGFTSSPITSINEYDASVYISSLATSPKSTNLSETTTTNTFTDSSNTLATLTETTNSVFTVTSSTQDPFTEFTKVFINIDVSSSLNANVTESSSTWINFTEITTATEGLNTAEYNVMPTEVNTNGSKSSTISVIAIETQSTDVHDTSAVAAVTSSSPVQTSSSSLELTQTARYIDASSSGKNETKSSDATSTLSSASTSVEVTITSVSNDTLAEGARSPRILPSDFSTIIPMLTSSTQNYNDRAVITETVDKDEHRQTTPVPSSLSTESTEATEVIAFTTEKEENQNEIPERDFRQIHLDNLTNEDLEGVVTTVFRKPLENCSEEWFRNQTALFHYWLLRTVAENFFIKTMNWSDDLQMEMDIDLSSVEVMFVLPTPSHTIDELVFTFLVLLNDTASGIIPGDRLLSLLNSNAGPVLNLLDVRQVTFLLGPYEAQDLEDDGNLATASFIRENGVIIIAVSSVVLSAVISLLIFAIYTRRKSRISVDCIRYCDQDRFQPDMNIDVEVGDINSAVVILQDEIQEKPEIKNGKLFAVGDDEGWVFPIKQIAIDDMIAPEVQDTKL